MVDVCLLVRCLHLAYVYIYAGKVIDIVVPFLQHRRYVIYHEHNTTNIKVGYVNNKFIIPYTHVYSRGYILICTFPV